MPSVANDANSVNGAVRPSQETCLRATSTTLRMKERGEGVSRYATIRKPQTRSIRRV
jgi:hypothetical protein